MFPLKRFTTVTFMTQGSYKIVPMQQLNFWQKSVVKNVFIQSL